MTYLSIQSRNYLFYIGDCPASISHTCLRLNFRPLKYHLFQKNCCLSPACPLFDTPGEDPKHYFLYCPSFAALLEKLFASGAQLLGNRWHCPSDKKRVYWFLNGISHDDLDTNDMFFRYVQSFISLSNRIC